LRFTGICYRAHDPRWAFRPISGDGAAIHGGRFNPKATPALYLSLDPITAIKEANQGFAHKIEPCAPCPYSVDCANVIDLRAPKRGSERAAAFEDVACPWFALAAKGKEPPSWRLARRLIAERQAGLLAPSFAPGANAQDHNLILWRWGDQPPHSVRAVYPSGRLPKDQLCWT
jgi:RES domain-containing protein